jgi:hypothetical protein
MPNVSFLKYLLPQRPLYNIQSQMIFNRKNIHKAGQSSNLLKLENKHRGGVNQIKGSRYEDFYALFLIIRNTSEMLRGKIHQAEIMHQARLCFVDDLLLRKNGAKYEFYQLKNTKNLSWKKQLLEDFKDQEKFNLKNRIDHLLVLVVSDLKILNKVVNFLPKEIKEVLVTHFFAPQNIEDLLRNNPEFFDAISEISAKTNPTIMDLDALGKSFLSEWIQLAKPGKFVNLKNLLKKSNRESTPIKSKWINNRRWKQVQEILEKIPNLTFFTDKGIFEYKIGDIESAFFVAKPDSKKLIRFLDRIIKFQPKTINEFEELL